MRDVLGFIQYRRDMQQAIDVYDRTLQMVCLQRWIILCTMVTREKVNQHQQHACATMDIICHVRSCPLMLC